MYDINEGNLLSAGIISAKVDGKNISTADPGIKHIKKDKKDETLTVQFANHFIVRAQLLNDSEITISVEGSTTDSVQFTARAPLSDRPMGCYLKNEKVNDMRTFTAWEAAEGETDGWLELIWEKPVVFQRIVIDEWLESGGEIHSWILEAGHKRYEYTPRGQSEAIVTYEPESETMRVIKVGESLGRKCVIDLDKPVTANVLKLSIHKASKRPGVWEIEVNPIKQTK